MDLKELKRRAAEEAVKYVEDDMVVGLGSGSTATIAIRLIGERVKNEGLHLIGIPTSKESEHLARSVGIDLGELSEYPEVNLTIDGADEVDPRLDMIKGLGGALVREKMVAISTDLEIIVVDDSKLVRHLCQKTPLPVEIVRFAYEATVKRLSKLGCMTTMRTLPNGDLFMTDNDNYIVDCKFQSIEDPKRMESDLNMTPGVVDNGLFVGLADKVIVASKDGIKVLEK